MFFSFGNGTLLIIKFTVYVTNLKKKTFRAAFHAIVKLNKNFLINFQMHCENYHSEPGECGEPSASPRNTFSTLCSVYLALFVIALQRFI